MYDFVLTSNDIYWITISSAAIIFIGYFLFFFQDNIIIFSHICLRESRCVTTRKNRGHCETSNKTDDYRQVYTHILFFYLKLNIFCLKSAVVLYIYAVEVTTSRRAQYRSALHSTITYKRVRMRKWTKITMSPDHKFQICLFHSDTLFASRV